MNGHKCRTRYAEVLVKCWCGKATEAFLLKLYMAQKTWTKKKKKRDVLHASYVQVLFGFKTEWKKSLVLDAM